MFKSYFFCKPVAIVIGTSPARKILEKEFSTDSKDGDLRQALNAFGNDTIQLFGMTSLVFETSREKHRLLKSLVMKAMTHEAVVKCMPTLEESSRFVIDEKILPSAAKKGSVTIEQHMWDMALDTAWRQILGLDFKSVEEKKEFHDNGTHFWHPPVQTYFFLHSCPCCY